LYVFLVWSVIRTHVYKKTSGLILSPNIFLLLEVPSIQEHQTI
jgi:hypothetical protein